MSNAKTALVLLPITLASMAMAIPAEESTKESDQLCQMLFDTYIVNRGKTNTSTIMAASHIVAERGWSRGFWRIVLRELRSGREQSEVGCVRVLGQMLAIDAAARDDYEPGDVVQPGRG